MLMHRLDVVPWLLLLQLTPALLRREAEAPSGG
jgi:hypothetical protein